MAAIAEVACRRCREQKVSKISRTACQCANKWTKTDHRYLQLRCSREHPVCSRCSRLGADCTYPDPPDRKLLASTRARPGKRKRNTSDDADSSPKDLRNGLQRHSTDGSNPESRNEPLGPDGSPLTDSLKWLLIDVYFHYNFNAGLILDKNQYKTSLAEGAVPEYLQHAIFAAASNFLSPICALAESRQQEILLLEDVRALGQKWARRAGTMVLSSIDQPMLDKMRTCQILGHYWFSQGDTVRNTMFTSIAYRAGRTLLTNDENWPEKVASVSWSEAEMRRRCWWATFIATRVNGDSYIIGSSVDTMCFNVPLPISERNFQYSVQEPLFTLSDIATTSGNRANVAARREPNAQSEIMRLVAHWSKIRDHVEGRSSLSTRDSIAELFLLEDWIFEYSRSLPPFLVYSKTNMYAQINETQQLHFTLLHVTHHMCRLILHASVVPQFSGKNAAKNIPRSILQSSARTAMESARAISQIASDLVSLEQDLARLAPFIGYCMYVAASIHIAFVAARDEALARESWRNLVPVLQVLKAMKSHWRNLDGLWSRIHILYERQASSIANNDIQSPASLEQVAETRRDAGRLTEALEESVLQYGLRRLRQKVEVDVTSSAAQRLEAAAESRRQSDTRAYTVQQQMQQQLTPDTLGSESMHAGMSNAGQFVHPAPAPLFPQMAPAAAFDDMVFDQELWSWDLNALGPGMLSFGDFTGESLGM